MLDFFAIDDVTGEALLIITDHLPWGKHDDEHLTLIQEKINVYLAFIESGEIVERFPQSIGRGIVISWVAKFPLSRHAGEFYRLAEAAIRGAGFQLRFTMFDSQSVN